MEDKFSIIPIDKLLKIFLTEKKNNQGFLGIPDELFIKSKIANKFQMLMFGQTLEFPLGVAAGPHSQLSQNIISAWLSGARYIELKTIQTLDELEIEKPCIDMQDEGYNCEWSQELKIEETFNQYLDAWIILHILDHEMGTQAMKGTIFNMSVGYNLEGILKENVQWFFSKMHNCQPEKKEKIALLREFYPDIDQIEIPNTISNSITLSTMHGCPPDEIESIAKYLLQNKKLHTYIKLNPTLLGAEQLREILNATGNFTTRVPDEAFAHDLKYQDAVPMIQRLLKIADNEQLQLGLKLTNTLESQNHKDNFTQAEMMYMSGRALHPISVNVARKLQNEFQGKLEISFAGGADAFNFAELLACGLTPVTVSSDILKPGGYSRLLQYFEQLEQAFQELQAESMDSYILKNSTKETIQQARLENLNNYADAVLKDERYQRQYLKEPNIKGKRKLSYFDCIAAPCQENCATSQDIPSYLHFTAYEQWDNAYATILKTNPQPGITGNICDHQCQLRCTRINYDQPLLIREIKRFVEENHSENEPVQALPLHGKKVGVIGAGPSGLSAAFYLRLAGFEPLVYESQARAGGMVTNAVPAFRLPDAKIDRDIERLNKLGVVIHYNTKVDSAFFEKLYTECDYVYVATGAPDSGKLVIPGIDANGVMEPLHFLFEAKKETIHWEGKHVAIIGGGNTAMDSARVANRLVGNKGSVTIIYRRTINEMPADLGEIKAVLEENITIKELTHPEKVLTENDKVIGLQCVQMKLEQTDKGQRPKPVKIDNSAFNLSFDIVIPAVGQEIRIDFMDEESFKPHPNTHEARLKRVFAGGDVFRGAATAIKAIGDGRKVAEHIAQLHGLEIPKMDIPKKQHSYTDLMKQRAHRAYGARVIESPLSERKTLNPVSFTLEKEAAIQEASRCLNCDELCNICVTVCPNRANYSYRVEPEKIQLYKAIRTEQGNKIETDKMFSIEQVQQILHIADFCNECGNCSTFCPTSGAPYKDKPHFYLSIHSFNEASEGFYLSKLPNQKQILIYKEPGGIRTLEKRVGDWLYETDHVKAIFATESFKLEDVTFKVPCAQQVHFDMAAEMKVLYHAAESLY